MRSADKSTTEETGWGFVEVELVEAYTSGVARSRGYVFKRGVCDIRFDGVPRLEEVEKLEAMAGFEDVRRSRSKAASYGEMTIDEG